MGTNLTAQKLTDIWRAGYCKETVEFAKTTTDDMEGATSRLRYLEGHVKQCRSCLFANALKEIESVVARRMGTEVATLFTQGQDITTLPNFRKYFDPVMAIAFKTHPIFSTSEGKLWLTQQAKRSGENYG